MRWVRLLAFTVLLGAILAKIAGYQLGTALLAVVALGEVCLIAFALHTVWSSARAYRGDGGDPWGAVESRLGQLVSPKVAPLIVSEIRIFLAFFRAIGWRPIVSGNRHGTTRYMSQYKTILFVLVVLIAVEVPIMHLILAKVLGSGGWKSTLQHVLIGLSAYGAIWLIGDARLMRESVHVLEPTGLSLHLGLRWSGMVPYEVIERIERAPNNLAGHSAAADITPVSIDVPNVVIHLREAVQLRALFHIPRAASEVRLFVDDPDALVSEISKRRGPDAAEKSCPD